MHKYEKMKQNKTAILPLIRLSSVLNHSFSMDSKGPKNPASEGNVHVHKVVVQFSNYIVTVPTPKEKLSTM